MAIPLIMPKQGQSVETCIITKWFKKKGDTVTTGDILFSYETDKAAFDVESPADGTILEIFFNDGDEVPVLANVAVIGTSGENTESFHPGKQVTAESAISTPVSQASIEHSPSVGRTEIDDHPAAGLRIRISPRAKHMADKTGLDYKEIRGSGPQGRIIVRDIERALEGKEVSEAGEAKPTYEYTEQPLTNVRRLIARSMHSSLQNSAQLTHHMSADVRQLLEARKKIKENLVNGTGKQDITLNDMICWCVIRALQKFPDANSHFLDDRIRTFQRVHLGIAVDTPRGLMVPAIKNADGMDLSTLSEELRSVAEACRKGNIDPELIQSTAASFTISNLGSYGVEMFTPVINLPQCAILGVCTIISRPADMGNNVFGFVPYIGLSLTYDHRAIDGGPATLFLKEIKKQIENFEL
jgi:pyruvate dehydrogenase E2 component (dihydrolipoamide acetyltransferase)